MTLRWTWSYQYCDVGADVKRVKPNRTHRPEYQRYTKVPTGTHIVGHGIPKTYRVVPIPDSTAGCNIFPIPGSYSRVLEHYLRFTTDVVLLFSDFVGFHDLWYPRYFKCTSKNDGTDITVCVSCLFVEIYQKWRRVPSIFPYNRRF
jgi:hypothetical protein